MLSATLVGTFDSFRKCEIEGCRTMVLPDVDEPSPRCREHSGAPTAWYTVDEWGASPVKFATNG